MTSQAKKTTNTLAQDRFIEEYLANGGFKLRACKKLGLAYSQVKVWFAEDEAFRARLAEVKDQWMEGVRAALMRRAMEKSDIAAIFLMKAHEPEVYDDAVRKAKWEAERGLTPAGVIPQRLILVREPLPEKSPEDRDS